MSLAEILAELSQILETYRGRDRIIRLLSYVSMYMARNGKTPAQVKWSRFSAEMGGCRVILRLFDDIPMLLYNISTGFGLKEKGILRPLEFIIGLLNQSYYPIEHLAWLRQKQILPGNAATLLLLGLVNFTLSLLGDTIKALIKLYHLQCQIRSLRKQQELDKDGMGEESSQNVQIRKNLKKLNADRTDLLLFFIQSFIDFINGVSWLPPGILWSQKLHPSTNGILGIVSSLVLLYRTWPEKTKS